MSAEFTRFRLRIDSHLADLKYLNCELEGISELILDYEKLASMYAEIYAFRDVFAKSFEVARKLFVLQNMQLYVRIAVKEHAINALEDELKL